MPGIGNSLFVNRGHPLLRGCLGWWMALPHRSGGSRLIDLMERDHGMLTNGPLWRGANGRPGGMGCLSFDGTDDYVSLPNTNSLNVTGPITIAAWVKTSMATSAGFIFGGYRPVPPYEGCGLIIGYPNLGTPGYINGTSITWVSANSIVSDGKWHHVVVSVSGTTATFYKDGIIDGTQTSAQPNSYSAIRSIGSFADGSAGANYSGLIDDFRIYNRSMADAELHELYDNSRSGYPGLIMRQSGYDMATAMGGTTWAPSLTMLGVG